MKTRQDQANVRARIDAVSAKVAGPGESGRRAPYSLSSASADPIKRRLRGLWTVREHSVGGDEYLSRFSARVLRGASLRDGAYLAEYEFRDGLCLKRVEIGGTLSTEDAEADYRYRLRVASRWDLDGADCVAITPELGYQYTELGGQPAAVKELDDPSEPVYVSFRFEGETLVLEEGDDIKRLERAT